LTKSHVNFHDVDEQNMTVTRRYLLTELQKILEYGVTRVFTRQTPSKAKVKWARIAVSAASAAGSILKDNDLEEIQQQIARIEAKMP
jgi:hypothetical protein